MDAKLNHSDLTALLAKKTNQSVAKAEIFTKAFFELIIDGLEKDGVVKINGLGTFKVTDVASRESVNVNTGEKIEIKGHKKLSFLPADALKDKVNKPFAMFEPVEIDDSYVDDSEENSATGASEEIETTPAAPVAENPEVAEEKIEEAKTEELPVNATEPEKEIETTPEPSVAENPAIAEEKIEEKKEQEPKRGCGKAILAIILIIILAAAILFLLPVIKENKNNPQTVEPKTEATVPAKTTVAPVDTTATAVDTVQTAPPAEEPYEFKMTEELASRSVGSVNIGDTLLYKAKGAIETHIVAENETLTRIALKYYGDKRLWPYIVQYNKLDNPNGLAKGMSLEIPRLEPLK